MENQNCTFSSLLLITRVKFKSFANFSLSLHASRRPIVKQGSFVYSRHKSFSIRLKVSCSFITFTKNDFIVGIWLDRDCNVPTISVFRLVSCGLYTVMHECAYISSENSKRLFIIKRRSGTNWLWPESIKHYHKLLLRHKRSHISSPAFFKSCSSLALLLVFTFKSISHFLCNCITDKIVFAFLWFLFVLNDNIAVNPARNSRGNWEIENESAFGVVNNGRSWML